MGQCPRTVVIRKVEKHLKHGVHDTGVVLELVGNLERELNSAKVAEQVLVLY